MSGALTAAIAKSAQLRRWSHALALLEASQHARLKPTAALYTAGIDACRAGGRWIAALKLLADLRLTLVPDVVCYGAVLTALSGSALWERCLDMLTSMSEWRIDINAACATEAVPGLDREASLASLDRLVRSVA